MTSSDAVFANCSNAKAWKLGSKLTVKTAMRRSQKKSFLLTCLQIETIQLQNILEKCISKAKCTLLLLEVINNKNIWWNGCKIWNGLHFWPIFAQFCLCLTKLVFSQFWFIVVSNLSQNWLSFTFKTLFWSSSALFTSKAFYGQSPILWPTSKLPKSNVKILVAMPDIDWTL